MSDPSPGAEPIVTRDDRPDQAPGGPPDLAGPPDGAAGRPAGPSPARGGRVGAFLRLVAIEHSVFALPFAYLSALTAMLLNGGQVRWGDLGLITVAMVGGRTFAMAANRIIDRRIDARNPRTARRELVTGAVSVRTAWTGAAVALAALLGAAALLNPLCLVLSPLAVVPLIVYPYGKRFTDWPHAILALAQAVAPVGAWLAVTGTFAGSGPAWVLAAAVGLWIGGFDLIYACQDARVDRQIGVRSVPARYGVRFALHASTLAHVVTFALFVWFGAIIGLGGTDGLAGDGVGGGWLAGWAWWTGLVLTAVAFGYQHLVVTPTDLSRVSRAFFTANGFVGIALFAFALGDLIRLGLRA